MAGFLIEGRTFFTRDSTDLRPTVLVISADRARPSRSRSSLMNFLSDCWYRLHAVTATPISRNHQCPESRMSPRPASPARPKDAKAACFTWAAGTSPETVSRKGPTRSSSVPRMPSE